MDNIYLMKKGKILTCGVYGHMCLIAKNYDLGAQNIFLEKDGERTFKGYDPGVLVKWKLSTKVVAFQLVLFICNVTQNQSTCPPCVECTKK